jgi:hypothetical protein
MSVPVPLHELEEAIALRDSQPFLLTVGSDGRSRCTSVLVEFDAENIVVAELGTRSAENCRANPLVSFLWPPYGNNKHSLIVDATVVSVTKQDGSNRVTMLPTSAVLHRQATEMTSRGDELASIILPTSDERPPELQVGSLTR